MMLVVGHAHVAEWKATAELERALARMSSTSLIGPVPRRMKWKRL